MTRAWQCYDCQWSTGLGTRRSHESTTLKMSMQRQVCHLAPQKLHEEGLEGHAFRFQVPLNHAKDIDSLYQDVGFLTLCFSHGIVNLYTSGGFQTRHAVVQFVNDKRHSSGKNYSTSSYVGG